MKGAWRRVDDTWPVANNINTYTTGKGRGEEMGFQREIYNQGRHEQMTGAIFGSILEQNLAQSWVNTRRMYGDSSAPGTIEIKNRIGDNINTFIEDAHNSGDDNQIDIANSIEKYLTDNNLWENGYSTNGTFGTGTIKDMNISTSSDVPEEFKKKPWLYSDNQDAMKISQFVDLFYESPTSDEAKALITDHVSGWEGDGSYGGVVYIKDNKLTDVTTYKKAAEAKANRLGLNKIDGTMYSNINVKESVHAPYGTNSTKKTLNNLNGIANEVGTEFNITGLYRTQEYNKTLDGSMDNSAHIQGRGIDMSLNDEFSKFLNNDGRVIKEEKVPAGQWYTIYNKQGTFIMRVLEEDDHFHIESPK